MPTTDVALGRRATSTALDPLSDPAAIAGF
jgi:hypothetical protein